MEETIVGALLILGLLCAPMHAEDTMKTRLAALKTWFQHFKQGLEESTLSSEYQDREITAVAAVRGAQQDSAEPNKVYWKDPVKAKKAAEYKKQKAELASAMAQILSGNIKEGDASLAAFEASYPKSPLLANAKKAREKAKELSDSAQ